MKRGGALLLPMLRVLGFVISGTTSVVKTVNDGKAARHQIEELQRHDLAMEQRAVSGWISLHTNADADCISAHIKIECKKTAKKTKRQKDDKNARGRNY